MKSQDQLRLSCHLQRILRTNDPLPTRKALTRYRSIRSIERITKSALQSSRTPSRLYTEAITPTFEPMRTADLIDVIKAKIHNSKMSESRADHSKIHTIPPVRGAMSMAKISVFKRRNCSRRLICDSKTGKKEQLNLEDLKVDLRLNQTHSRLTGLSRPATAQKLNVATKGGDEARDRWRSIPNSFLTSEQRLYSVTPRPNNKLAGWEVKDNEEDIF